MKLLEKTRIGSKLKRRYAQPCTPLDRLLHCSQADPLKIHKLKNLRESIDPLPWLKASSKSLSPFTSWLTVASLLTRPTTKPRTLNSRRTTSAPGNL